MQVKQLIKQNENFFSMHERRFIKTHHHLLLTVRQSYCECLLFPLHAYTSELTMHRVSLHKVNQEQWLRGLFLDSDQLSCQHKSIDHCPRRNTPCLGPLALSIPLAQDREQLTGMSSHYHSQHGATCRQTGRGNSRRVYLLKAFSVLLFSPRSSSFIERKQSFFSTWVWFFFSL